jgi:hypothetical protein
MIKFVNCYYIHKRMPRIYLKSKIKRKLKIIANKS